MKWISVLILLIVSQYGLSQTASFATSNNLFSVTITDNFGKSLQNSKYDGDIVGSPFLIDDWKESDLNLGNGKIESNIKIKLNIESNELYFLDSSNKVYVAKAGLVKEFSFINTMEKDEFYYLFRCGYPQIDNQKNSFYYRVLIDGKVELLEKIKKDIQVKKDDMSGEIKKEFIETVNYYIFCNGAIFQYRNDKELLLQQMADKNGLVETFLSSNKINFKKIADVERLVKYYNSLK